MNKTRPLLVRDLSDALNWLKEEGLYHADDILSEFPSPELRIRGSSKKLVSFCSNNYLGLSRHPKVVEAARKALLRYGVGTCESRKLGGNLYLLEKLEEALADFKHSEAAMIFATGLMTNVGVIQAIVDINFYMDHFYGKRLPAGESIIVSDELNHRSIQMGIKLSRANVYRYNHSNMEHLEEILNNNKGKKILIVTDGVFSMDGDIANLPEIIRLKKKYWATLMVDDAHGTGVWGKTGRGSAEHFGLDSEVDIKMGTLSKAFGAMGGFIAADKDVIDMLKVNTSTYYFTSSLPADQAAALIVVTNIIKNNSYKLRKKLWKNVHRVIKGIMDIGFDVPFRWTQIIPIIIGDEKKCMKAEKILQDRGILISSAMVPAVAPGKARLRVTINASHTDEHIDKLLDALKNVHKKLDLEKKVYLQKDIEKFENSMSEYIKDYIND